MSAREIRPGIFWVGINDRTTDLFEGVWPLPHGVSYNAYLVVGEKIALIDGAKAPFAGELLRNISEVVPPEKIDYLVVNHMEPDHSGSLPQLRRAASGAAVLATQNALPMLARFYGITEGVRAVSDGESLDLGGKTLRFFHIPFVHWPETMATYEETQKVLFSCDAFGGFRALDGVLFDDEVDVAEYEDEALRYFSNIVGMQSKAVLRAIEKLADLAIEVIAPSHGLVWRKDPGHIVELYSRWARMEARPEVTIVFGSMYGFTARMAEAVARGIAEEGVPVRVLDAGRVHVSFLIREAWKRKGLVIGAPTYDTGIFPPVEYFLRLLERKRLRDRVVGLFGSYGWKGGSVPKMRERVEALGWELVGEVSFHGAPTPEDLARARELGRKVAERVGAVAPEA
ncbi:FprA family A-type flavoprotein [Candidatus Acetothermia bacterium]|nr:MAG: FprA family A-type flavoprotein [Candidatus Acetothermia bacterium]